MNTKLDFTIKEVYGRTLFYPQNKQAELACKFLGKKTLVPAQIKVLIEMGFDVAQVHVKTDLDTLIEDLKADKKAG